MVVNSINNDIYEKNIVLIGMPGCGKTTIGRLLANKLNMDFVDIDEYIVKLEGRSIVDIFKQGEDHFRSLETKAISEIVKAKGIVIGTGGGVVKNKLNMELLKSNGIIVFINRPVEEIYKDIDISIRPLLKENINNLWDIYKERYELYKSFSDYILEDFNTPNEGVLNIITKFFT